MPPPPTPHASRPSKPGIRLDASTHSYRVKARLSAASLAVAIFCFDAFTAQDLAIAVLYVVVLLIGTSGAGDMRRGAILKWSGACGVMAVAGFAIFRLRGAPPMAFWHLLLSLVVIVTTTLLLLRAQAMNGLLAQGDRRYRTIFDTLAIAIWEHDFSVVADRLAQLRLAGVTDMRRYVNDHPAFVSEMRGAVRITDVNATALSMMGVRNKADFFESLADFLPETDDSFAECILAIDERRPLFQTEAIVIPISREPKQVIVAFGLGPDACLECVPGSILDVSHRRALETQILRAREELADAQRTSVLAAISASIAHELNQPMSAIHSFADATRRWIGRSPPNLAEAGEALAGLTMGVEHARSVMHRVRSLVGESRIDMTEVELDGLIATTVALLRREAAENGARLVVTPLSDQTLAVRGDRILLKQVLVNLITNAIQAMLNIAPEDRIVGISFGRRGDQAVVTIADQGPGWDQVDDARVFGSFYTTKANGMGLGLSISRTTVERHGGSLRRYNAEGGGAVIDVLLPLDVESGPAACESSADRDFEGIGI